VNSDFKDLLRCFNEAGARYLVVGGYAVMEYTEPRYTKDLDLWVGTDKENAPRVYRALAEFGAPVTELTEDDFCEPDAFFQIGVAPVRVDIITTLSGPTFEEAWNRREVRTIDDLPVPFMSRNDLIQAKLAAGRRQDRADAAALRRAARQTLPVKRKRPRESTE
jgi:hypothetical protein